MGKYSSHKLSYSKAPIYGSKIKGDGGKTEHDDICVLLRNILVYNIIYITYLRIPVLIRIFFLFFRWIENEANDFLQPSFESNVDDIRNVQLEKNMVLVSTASMSRRWVSIKILILVSGAL